ncbi:MAG: tryptophan halogenase, partial [Novosphingobium sp.]
MAGQGLEPASWNPIAEGLSDTDLGRFLESVERAAIEAVRPMPQHIDYLASLVTAEAARGAAQ